MIRYSRRLFFYYSQKAVLVTFGQLSVIQCCLAFENEDKRIYIYISLISYRNTMDLYLVAQKYLEQILNTREEDGGNDISVLLLDKVTAPIISLVSSQSELLSSRIYLVDNLENTRDKMRHLKCICFVSPCESTLSHLVTELANPNYRSYKLYFNNAVPGSFLERLAEADDLEVVSKVMELFLDYHVINSNLFTIPEEETPIVSINNASTRISSLTSGLISLFLSLNCKPAIRFEKNSFEGQQLASSIVSHINANQNLFSFPESDSPPLLFILDRKNDPITPLLMPWTFQSMIHELIGIKRNIVSLTNEKIVLSHQDTFFNESMYLNFGDLSDKVKNYVDLYKQKSATSMNLNSIQDMKFFLESFPEFRKLSDNVAKYVSLTTELDNRVKEMRLWDVSEVEQSVVCNDNSEENFQLVEALVCEKSPDGNATEVVPELLKVKLVILYALKYESQRDKVRKLIEMLKTQQVSQTLIDSVTAFLDKCGSSKRLVLNQGLADKASNLVAALKKNHESNNVYMQHIPRLETLISLLFKNKLSLQDFPSRVSDGVQYDVNVKPQRIIFFFIGGATYEEARIIANFNKETNESCKLLIGGDSLENSSSFMSHIN